MMLQKGSMLVEVMIAIAISSVVFGTLFQSLNQSNGIFARVVATSSIERTVATIQQQFENDFSGMIAPSVVIPDEETEVKEGDDKKSQEKKPEPVKKDDKDKDKDKKKEPFKSFIFETGDKGTVTILSFVTVNPLLVYKQTSPRAVRVAYRVIPDPENEGALLLNRQQSEQLDLARFQRATTKEVLSTGDAPVRTFEVAHKLQSISFTFFVEKKLLPESKKPGEKKDEKKPDGKLDVKKDEPEKREFVLIDDWLKLSEEERKKYEPQTLPLFAQIKIALLDDRNKVQNFEFWFAPLCGQVPVEIKGVNDLPSLAESQQKAGMEEYQNRTFIPTKGATDGSPGVQQPGQPKLQLPSWVKGAQLGGGR